MILEKVYDELYGMIEDLKKKIQAAEKSDVTITPALESGLKLADFEIDGTEGAIFAPTPLNPFFTLEESYSSLTGCTDASYFNVYSAFNRSLFYAEFSITTSADVAANSYSDSLLTIGENYRPSASVYANSPNTSASKQYPATLNITPGGAISMFNTASVPSRFYANGTVMWVKRPANLGREAEPTKKTTKKK